MAIAKQLPLCVAEYVRAHNFPPDCPYHPRYNAVGIASDCSDQILELACFERDWPTEYGGLGAYGHLRNFIGYTWPDIEFNDWLEWCLRSLTDNTYAHRIGNTVVRYVNWVGAGSSGKTFAAGLFSTCWWLSDLVYGVGRARSSVTLTSTSKGIINQRMWPVFQKLFHDAKMHPDGDKFTWGRMIDSMKIIEPLPPDGDPKRRDGKHVISALAVEPGELQSSLDKIKGRHTERMMLIIDEANSTPQAIFECIPNMLTGIREFVLLVIGNAGSRLDPHGLCCEPSKGWKSITIDDTLWETKGVAKWGISPGVCLHFDASKSPNVLAGRTVHKHIYSFERWQQVLRMGDEYRNTLQHWSQDRGFWPPDGISNTVFSEAMVVSHNGTAKFHWLDVPTPMAAIDPAFGGDNCVLQFGWMGIIPGGRKALMLGDHQLVPFDPESPDAIDFQIARYVIRLCKQRGIEPEHFGLDATGTGRGVAAFVNQLWSTRIQAIEFGGAASELPASADDPRKSCDVYSNRVTELWYSARDLLVADQLKGLHQQVITEFCARTYKFIGRKYALESKTDMKKRLGYSPDYADATAVLVDVARRNGLAARPWTTTRRPTSLFGEDTTQDVDAIYEDSYNASNTFASFAEVNY